MKPEEGKALLEALEAGEPEHPAGRALRGISRQPFEYSTSFPLELLRLEFEGGAAEELVLKNLARNKLAPAALDAKPAFVHDPLREAYVYEELLAPRGLDGGIFCGAWSDADRGESRLLLARVHGPVLLETGERTIWEAAARLAARVHATMADDVDRHRVASDRLLDLGPALLWTWMERAVEFARHGAAPSSELGALDRVADACRHVEKMFAKLPRTLVHGELYVSNVLIDEQSAPARVVFIDWEVAGIGPGLIDLAALTSGQLPRGWRNALESSYRDELGCRGRIDLAGDPLDLSCCRLYLAVQRLGSAPRSWEPPEEHHQEWLAIALELAAEIGR